MTPILTSAQVLSNEDYSVLITANGGGYSAFKGYALTRWVPDPTSESYGHFCYVRDLESNSFWSIGRTPVPGYQATGGVRIKPNTVSLWSSCNGILASCTVSVTRDCNAEVRRIRLTNQSDRTRHLDLTTFAELSLNTLSADAAHPAFSKLFVQTTYDEHRRALFASRRPRSPEDCPLWLAQKISGFSGQLEFETDRARFIGRNRSSAQPSALSVRTPLTGSVGAVLDPAFCMRVPFVLAAGESAEVQVVVCAGDSRAELEGILDGGPLTPLSNGSSCESLGIPATWGPTISLNLQSCDWSNPDTPIPVRVLPSPRANYGAFSVDGREYVLSVSDDVQPTPQPWINVIANESFGCLISEVGAGYTWAANSRENRITTWSNDPVTDPHTEALYVRDDDDGDFWSPMPGPVAGGTYETRHGFGYSYFLHDCNDIGQSTCVFVPRRDPVKIVYLTLRNLSGRVRNLSLGYYAQLVLGAHAADTRATVETTFDDERNVIFAINPERGEFSGRCAFLTAVVDHPVRAHSATGSRAEFIGAGRTLRAPAALESADRRSGSFGRGLDPCAALTLSVTIEPGGTLQCAFLLGEAASESDARACIERFARVEAAAAALLEVTAYWRDFLSAVQVTTPAPGLDLMMNGWLAYQNLACRMWARSAFYQSGGAYGFRDQLQDASALLYLDPRITRAQILLHAAHQFVEGDVLHWWHPPTSKGIRTRFSDDLLWLPYISQFYAARTGDESVWDEEVRFLTADPLEPPEDEVFVFPEDAGEAASLYEHCCRAIDRSLTTGAHGLPLIGTGDWNDGMNRVGREGRGESVWLGFFLVEILDDFIPLCKARKGEARAARYAEYLAALALALNDAGWDGEWYRRAYYDNGAPMGSTESDECRIDALAQAWAVISGAAPPERAARAMAAVQRELVSERDRIIRLLTPPFDKTPNDPGYIKGYVPGVRENGGQYTHAAMWVIRALAEMGDNETAAPLLEMLSPTSHTSTPARVAIYQGEPYVVAADVYGEPPHVGRAGWTWYTGSAGWMYRVMLESVLGFELDNNAIIKLRPCVPSHWPGFTLRYRFADGTHYRFVVGRTSGPTSTSDGMVADGAVVLEVAHDGGEHEVLIQLGTDVCARYQPRVSAIAEPLLRMTSL